MVYNKTKHPLFIANDAIQCCNSKLALVCVNLCHGLTPANN